MLKESSEHEILHPEKTWRKKFCAAENQTETANTLMGCIPDRNNGCGGRLVYGFDSGGAGAAEGFCSRTVNWRRSSIRRQWKGRVR